MSKKLRVKIKGHKSKNNNFIYDVGDLNETNVASGGNLFFDVVAVDEHDQESALTAKEQNQVAWIWHLLENRPAFEAGVHNARLTGWSKNAIFPHVYGGGGVAWIEPYWKDSKPVNNTSAGAFIVRSIQPKIIDIEWKFHAVVSGSEFVKTPAYVKFISTETEDPVGSDYNGEELRYGQWISLHIYTRGLYGQEIEIELIDLVKQNETLLLYEKEDGNYKGDTDHDNATLPVNGKSSFQREVVSVICDKSSKGDLYTVESPAGIVTRTQKTIVDIYLDPFWENTNWGTKRIEIYPRIYYKDPTKSGKQSTGKNFNGQTLKLGEDEFEKSRMAITGNVPVVIGKINTDPGTFHSCRYDKIEVKQQKQGGAVVVWDSGRTVDQEKGNIQIDIIAGKKETYLVNFQMDTVECHQKPKHTDRELLIIDIPENYLLTVDPTSDAMHMVDEKKLNLAKAELKHKSTNMGIKAERQEPITTEKGSVTVRRNQIEFDGFYNYDLPENPTDNPVATFFALLNYFWLPELGPQYIRHIHAQANTCAYKQNIDIAIYPDIKWSLVFGFNVKKDDMSDLFPGWCADRTIKSFEKIGEKVTEKMDNQLDRFMPEPISAKNQQQINKGMIKVLNRYQGTSKKEPETIRPQRGKLNALIDIMKKVDLSLKAKLYDDMEVDMSREFVESVFRQYVAVIDLIKKAVEILEGKHDKRKDEVEGEKKIKEFIKTNKTEDLRKALMGSTQEVEIDYPQLKIGASWQYEMVDAAKYPLLAGRQGLGVAVQISAAPLIGIKITWHILDLLCRRHPIAYAILAAVKTLSTILADDPDAVKVELWVEGKIGGAIDFQHNMLAGAKSIAAKCETSIQAGVDISITIKGVVRKGSYEAVTSLGFGAGAEVGLGTEDIFGVDDTGIYFEKKLIFEGIKLFFKAEAIAQINELEIDKNGKIEREKLFSIGDSIEGEITLLPHTFTTEKFYLQ